MLRGLLNDERETLLVQVNNLDREAEEMLVDRDGLEYDEDDGSGAATNLDRDRVKEFAAEQRLKLAEIDVALVRVAEGSYGRCDECFEPISRPRLEAQVPVFTCIDCRAAV